MRPVSSESLCAGGRVSVEELPKVVKNLPDDEP